MNGIYLTRDEHRFLSLGLAKKDTHMGKLAMYMSDGDGMVFSTNGYSLHVIRHNTKHPRGYYLWNASAENLMRVADNTFEDKNDLIKNALDVRKKYIDALTFNEPLDIVSFDTGSPKFGLNLQQPANQRTVVGFRKGIWKGKECSICLGSNFAPVEWNENGSGEVCEADITKYIAFDLKLLIAICKHIGDGKMLWRDATSPAIFGNIEGWHAIIMPMLLGGTKK